MRTLGAVCNDEERESFMAVWRYSGHLMGIPETILFRGEEDALKLHDVGNLCEPDAPVESVVIAHSLINSAPLIAGMTDPEERQNLAQYVYRISRGLIGRDTAAQLLYPSISSFASFSAVKWFMMQQRYGHILSKLFQRRAQDSDFTRFTSLLETSLFDKEGIHYRLPDHVYTEEPAKY